MTRLALLACAAVAPLAFAQPAIAQVDDTAVSVSELIVTGQIAFRDRVETTAPVLSYDLDYFQRFEPLTAGDAMKRVPSVTFLSDVLESDGARLRGLDPGYTQILINGERVPGAGLDRSFFVDRIPAELIERIEVVRSSSANRSGDAVAGALNIVLRDAQTLEGGYLRAGAILLNDGRVRETLGGVWSGQAGPGRLLVGASLQGRRNPKEKLSLRYDRPGGTLDNSEVQTDTRNGTDYSLNAAYEVPVAGGDLELSGLFVRTERLADEDSLEYLGGRVRNADLLVTNDNDVDITTDNWSLSAKFTRDMFGGKTRFKAGYSVFDDQQSEVEEEYEFLRDANPFPEDDRFTGDLTLSDLQDKELALQVSHERDVSFGVLEFGLQYVDKSRDTEIVTDRNRVTIPNPPATRPTLPGVYGPFLPVVGGINDIEETRLDGYVMLSGGEGPLKWEAGLRYETTETKIADQTAPAALRNVDNDYGILLPSAHLKYSMTAEDRITASVARTVRRPNFNQISPANLLAEFGDNDFVGNAQLDPESAWGLDVGYERRLGTRGVAGVNVFYRKVSDLVEVANTGVVGSEGAGTFVLTPRNTGDGSVWGIEFDLSTPLTAFGMENTGVFLNYSWLDSDIDDEFGSRRFNDQSDYVFNVGFIHDIPSWGAAFGATYRKQG
uniref:TonB-dependent receptor plug domain-containing protein n=1 Tax=Phenylobacterium sp. TaxID=1871053 RepID=UPI00286A92A0